MKNNIGKKYYGIILLIIAAVFNLLLFLLVKSYNRKVAFWVCYGFVMAGFVLNALAFYLAPSNNENNVS